MRQMIVKLAKMLTDCMDVKMGFVRMDEGRWEYKMLDTLLTDEMAELMLKMGRRKPTTAAELSKRIGWTESRIQTILDELSKIGLVEYNRHNSDRHRQYVVPIFVVGSAENLVLNKPLLEKHPEIAEFFYQMAEEPLKLISHMVPPGGAGLGFHAIPIERAIPRESRALNIEQLSYWLEKYRDQLAISDCVCRTSMILRGEGCGELPDKGCIQLGDYADYLVETGKAERASLDEVIALLKRSEENGFMHQVTNGDGGEDIFAICNCSVGNCFALRCSQQFNNPNGSASTYRAVVDRDKCVACGKCAEVCPAGAVRLGRKLDTKNGPVVYENEPLAAETKGWSEKNWHPDYRDRNQINCYPIGTAPCKCACPTHASIQGVLQLVKDERYLDALKLLRQDNPFPSVCASACDRRCEKVCMRGSVDTPMEISATMTRLADMQQELWEELVPHKVRLKGGEQGLRSARSHCRIRLCPAQLRLLSCTDELSRDGVRNCGAHKPGGAHDSGRAGRPIFGWQSKAGSICCGLSGTVSLQKERSRRADRRRTRGGQEHPSLSPHRAQSDTGERPAQLSRFPPGRRVIARRKTGNP